MADEKQAKKKVKLPTALKRLKQSQKIQMQHRMVKSRIRTACRHLTENLKSNKKESLPEDLKCVYSQVDKAVKAKIYKPNKAKRIKAHYAKSVYQAKTA